MDFIGICILWMFALYGFIDILKMIISNLVHKRIESNGIFVIIAVKNQEQQIENFFRSVIFKILYGKESYIRNVVVTDLSSEDNTKAILQKLSEDYHEIKLVEWEECKKQIDGCYNSENK